MTADRDYVQQLADQLAATGMATPAEISPETEQLLGDHAALLPVLADQTAEEG